jgi:hypothetical protein
MPAGTVVTSVKDAIAVILRIFESANREIVFITPPSFMELSANYASMEGAERFIRNGGVVRGILPVSRDDVIEVRMRLDTGYHLRHSDLFHESFMIVGDRQQSISAINVGVQEYTLDTPITSFWSDSPAFAEYLLTIFENAWSKAIPAEQRIQELLKQG